MIKAVIVDDEKKSVQTMSLMLSEYCPNVEVVGFAHSALEGAKEVRNIKILRRKLKKHITKNHAKISH